MAEGEGKGVYIEKKSEGEGVYNVVERGGGGCIGCALRSGR